MSIEQALPRLLTNENTTQAHSQRHQQWAPSWVCCIGLNCTWWETWKPLHEHVLFNLRTLLPSNFLVPHIPDLHIPRGWGTIEMLIPSILLTMYCIAHHTMPRIHPGLLEAKPGLSTWVGCWMRWVMVSYGLVNFNKWPGTPVFDQKTGFPGHLFQGGLKPIWHHTGIPCAHIMYICMHVVFTITLRSTKPEALLMSKTLPSPKAYPAASWSLISMHVARYPAPDTHFVAIRDPEKSSMNWKSWARGSEWTD